MAEALEAEVVVVGAGPAGIAAACSTAETGREVLLVDENPACGGQIWRHRSPVDVPRKARRWLDRLTASPVRSLPGTTVIDVLPDGGLLAESDERPVEIRSDLTVLATGARELFLPFSGWTLPGVIGVGAAQALVKAGVVVRGMEVVLAGSGPLLLSVGALLKRSGARLSVLAEQASTKAVMRFGANLWRDPVKIGEAIRYRLQTWGTRYRTGVWALAADGDDRIREVQLTDGKCVWQQSCDLLCCSYGLVPNVELARWLGCRIAEERVVVDDNQLTDCPKIYCVGESTGIGGADLSIVEGEIAAAHLLGNDSVLPGLKARRARLTRFSSRLESTFRPRPELAQRVRPTTIVCRCEDVAHELLDPDWSMRQAKLYTRLGMGPCQGRVCGAAVHYLFGWQADTVRPPLKPCRMSSLTGTEQPGVGRSKST